MVKLETSLTKSLTIKAIPSKADKNVNSPKVPKVPKAPKVPLNAQLGDEVKM